MLDHIPRRVSGGFRTATTSAGEPTVPAAASAVVADRHSAREDPVR
jgi:hypothetical protein